MNRLTSMHYTSNEGLTYDMRMSEVQTYDTRYDMRMSEVLTYDTRYDINVASNGGHLYRCSINVTIQFVLLI